MKRLRLYLIPAILVAGIFTVTQAGEDEGTLAHAAAGGGTTFNTFYTPSYQIPDAAGMSASAARGKDLVHSTYTSLGAGSAVRASNGLPYVGNKLSCTNCHMGDGTQPNASPLIVVAQKYAAPGLFNSRSNNLLDVPGRVNGCFERSLVGQPLPLDSQWMTDIVAYIDFLGTGVQPGYTSTQVPGQGFPSVALLTRAADPVRGKEIFTGNCASCHRADGNGSSNVPPVWGTNSFGLMSGMGRLATATTLVYGAMPRNRLDPTDPNTRMSQEDAWDVSAYLLSNSRPFQDRFVADWTGVGPDGMPNWLRKPASASYDFTMPRSDAGVATDDPTKPAMFLREQHTFGPFQPIEDALKAARIERGFP